MSYKASIGWGILVCIVFATMLRTFVHAEETAVPAPQLYEFGNGIVMISIERTVGLERYSRSATLKNAKLIKLGERYFIRGQGYVAKANQADNEYAWYQGIDASYAWDGVVDFCVFTPEQFEEYVGSLKRE